MVKINIKENYGNLLFYIGIFLLPSAIALGSIFLIAALIIGQIKRKDKFFKDKWNIPFFMAGILMIISTAINNNYPNLAITESTFNKQDSILALANWIPFIFCFWGFQPFLETNQNRKNAALIFIMGTFPILLTGFAQSFFNFYGPFETFGGLITWYQRPLVNSPIGLTGLFNNPNYAGNWLNLIFPFSIATIITNSYKKTNLFISIIFAFSIFLAILLTNSRASSVAMLITFILLLGWKSLKIVLPFLIIFFLGIKSFLGSFISKILNIFSPGDFKYLYHPTDYDSRLRIWESAIKNVFENPLLGSGSGTFSVIYENETGVWKGHAHNLPLELFSNYGIPAGLFLILPIFFIAYLTFSKLSVLKKNLHINLIFDQAWITSLSIIMINHLVDITYFDGRINLTCWILLAGARNILKEKTKE